MSIDLNTTQQLREEIERVWLIIATERQELALTKQKLEAAEQDLAQHKEMLRQEMVETNKAHSRAAAAEQAIRESQEQEPEAWIVMSSGEYLHIRDTNPSEREDPEEDSYSEISYIPLYAKPVIIQQSAEQLHIKELREALEVANYYLPTYGRDPIANTHISLINDVLAKQPDTRALEKALLEAEIKAIKEASTCDYNSELYSMIIEREEKLAELNKE